MKIQGRGLLFFWLVGNILAGCAARETLQPPVVKMPPTPGAAARPQKVVAQEEITPTPLGKPETDGVKDQQDSLVAAIEEIRPRLGLPDRPLEFVGNQHMINSPSGDLPVALYQDPEGRKYFVQLDSHQVVEIDAREMLNSLEGSGAPALEEEALRQMAWQMAEDTVPDFARLSGGLAYEASGKGRNLFFDWRGRVAPGGFNPPFLQIGLHSSGVLFAYYNTLLVGQP